MTAAKATAEIFQTAFHALSRKERNAVIEKLLLDREFMEDLIDLVTLEQRRRQSSITLEEYIARRSKKH